jgi:hypothetical protein
VRDTDDRCEASGSSSEAGADSAGYEGVDETTGNYERIDMTHSDDWAEGGDRSGNGERVSSTARTRPASGAPPGPAAHTGQLEMEMDTFLALTLDTNAGEEFLFDV